MIETKTKQEFIEYLNSLIEADPVAMRKLLMPDERIPCSKALADHPTMPARYHEGETPEFTLSALGVICGFFTHDDKSAAIAVTDHISTDEGLRFYERESDAWHTQQEQDASYKEARENG